MGTASKTTTIYVRLSPELKTQVVRKAQERELPLNTFVVEVLKDAAQPSAISPLAERVGRWQGARVGFLLMMRVCELLTDCCRAGYAEAGPVRGDAAQRLASEQHQHLMGAILAKLTSAVDDLQHELLDDTKVRQRLVEDAKPASENAPVR